MNSAHQDDAPRPEAQAEHAPKHDENDDGPAVFERLGRRIDELPYVEEAERAVLQAQAELRRARRRYRQVKQKAKAELGSLGQKNLEELAEEGLEFVRRQPGLSLGIAAFFGFLIGRLFRR